MKWISVNNKQKPNGQEDVLICDSFGNVSIGYIHGPKSGWICHDPEVIGDIVAWQPKPKPYKP